MNQLDEPLSEDNRMYIRIVAIIEPQTDNECLKNTNVEKIKN